MQFKFCRSCQVFEPRVGYSDACVRRRNVNGVNVNWCDERKNKLKNGKKEERRARGAVGWGGKRDLDGQGGESTFWKENCAIRVNSRKSWSVYFPLFSVLYKIDCAWLQSKKKCSVQDVFQLVLSFCSSLFNFERKIKHYWNFDHKNASS